MPGSKTVTRQEGSQVCSSLKKLTKQHTEKTAKKEVEEDAVSREQLLAQEKQLTKQLRIASSLQRVWKRISTRFDGDAAEDRESGATSAGDVAGASEDSERSQCFEICMCEKTMEKRWP